MDNLISPEFKKPGNIRRASKKCNERKKQPPGRIQVVVFIGLFSSS
jgi:hypothetical protein